MEIQQLINEKLSENLNKHGRIIGFCKIGNMVTLYGYIRKINENYVLFEDNETAEKFKIKNVISFEVIPLK
jgi:ferredoxin-fold anticodon binding domain-containing protein